MKKRRTVLIAVLAAILVGVLGYSAYQIASIATIYNEESKTHQAMLGFKPADAGSSNDISEPVDRPAADDETAAPVIVNQSVIDMREKYPDAVGWLVMDGTEIDYPFVQSFDNEKYNERNLDMKYLAAGTITLDYRNSPEMTDFVSYLYGHHMRNGSMFGRLKDYKKTDYFRSNTTGCIYLPHQNLKLSVVAILTVASGDEQAFRFDMTDDVAKQEFLDYIRDNAIQLDTEAVLTSDDRFVVLSTCAYDFDNARMILVTKVVE